MGQGQPIMDMFQIWFGSIGRVNGLRKNKFNYYICNWIHDSCCDTYAIWTFIWTLSSTL
jgi:hypothetical protein